MQNKKNNKKRNPVAKELYTPKYKSKVIPNKKKDYMSDDDYNLLIEDVDDNFVEIIENNKLKQGPKVPFKLNTRYDQAVLDRKNRIIITSQDHGLIVYDHQAGTFTNYDNFKLKEYRTEYAAILQ